MGENLTTPVATLLLDHPPDKSAAELVRKDPVDIERIRGQAMPASFIPGQGPRRDLKWSS